MRIVTDTVDPIERDKQMLDEWQETRRKGRGCHIARCAFWWALAFSIGPALVAFFRNDTEFWVYVAFSGPLAIAAGVFFGVVSWKQQEKKFAELISKDGSPDEED